MALRFADRHDGGLRRSIDAAFHEELRRHFTDDQILDLGMTITFASGWQRFIEAFGVVPDRWADGLAPRRSTRWNTITDRADVRRLRRRAARGDAAEAGADAGRSGALDCRSRRRRRSRGGRSRGAGRPPRSSVTCATSRSCSRTASTRSLRSTSRRSSCSADAARGLVPWRFVGEHPLDPDEWAEERQYARSDPREALAAFQRRRAEV